jgi:hypothetical protein
MEHPTTISLAFREIEQPVNIDQHKTLTCVRQLLLRHSSIKPRPICGGIGETEHVGNLGVSGSACAPQGTDGGDRSKRGNEGDDNNDFKESQRPAREHF